MDLCPPNADWGEGGEFGSSFQGDQELNLRRLFNKKRKYI